MKFHMQMRLNARGKTMLRNERVACVAVLSALLACAFYYRISRGFCVYKIIIGKRFFGFICPPHFGVYSIYAQSVEIWNIIEKKLIKVKKEFLFLFFFSFPNSERMCQFLFHYFCSCFSPKKKRILYDKIANKMVINDNCPFSFYS